MLVAKRGMPLMSEALTRWRRCRSRERRHAQHVFLSITEQISPGPGSAVVLLISAESPPLRAHLRRPPQQKPLHQHRHEALHHRPKAIRHRNTQDRVDVPVLAHSMVHAQPPIQGRHERELDHDGPREGLVDPRVGAVGRCVQVPGKVGERDSGEEELEAQADEVRAEVGCGDVLGEARMGGEA